MTPSDDLYNRLGLLVSKWGREHEADMLDLDRHAAQVMAIANLLGTHLFVAEQAINEDFANSLFAAAMRGILHAHDVCEKASLELEETAGEA